MVRRNTLKILQHLQQSFANNRATVVIDDQMGNVHRGLRGGGKSRVHKIRELSVGAQTPDYHYCK